MVRPIVKLAVAGAVLGTAAAVLLVGACATRPPAEPGDSCAIFEEKRGWYKDMKRSEERWGVPVHVQLAIIHQESRFVHDAKPPRRRLLGFIPWRRLSSAYGYAQAQDSAWEEYLRKSGAWGADRDEFDDAIDFVGWYTHTTQRTLGISKWDAYGQYLAYHEGRGGYKKGSWKSKPWLQKVATKVKNQAARYNAQLKGCKGELDDAIDGWFFF